MTTTLVPLPPTPMTSPRSSPNTLASPAASPRERKPSLRKRVSSFLSRRRSSSSVGSPEARPSHSRTSSSSYDLASGATPPGTISSATSSPYLSPNALPHDQANGNGNGNGGLKVDPTSLAPSLTRSLHLAPSPIAESPMREAAAAAESPRGPPARVHPSPLSAAAEASAEQLSPYVIVPLEPEIKEEPEGESAEATTEPTANTPAISVSPSEEPVQPAPVAAAAQPATVNAPSAPSTAPAITPTSPAAVTVPTPAPPFPEPELAPASPPQADGPTSTPPAPGLGLELEHKAPAPAVPTITEELVASPPEIVSPPKRSPDAAARTIQHAWRVRVRVRVRNAPLALPKSEWLHPGVLIVGVPDDAASSVGDFERDTEMSEVEVEYVSVLPEKVEEKPEAANGSANGHVNGNAVRQPRPTPVRKLTNGVPKWVEDSWSESLPAADASNSVFLDTPAASPVLTRSTFFSEEPAPTECSPAESTLQRVWSSARNVAERALASLPVSVPLLGVFAQSAEGIPATEISRAGTPLPPVPVPSLQGWTTYLLPDGREYYYHAALRAVSDVWPVPLPLPSPPGLEVHIRRDGSQRWIDHSRCAVYKTPTLPNGPDDRSTEVAYWSYVAAHPAHFTLPDSVVQEAAEVLAWTQADTAIHNTHFSSPFTHEEAVELSGLLRDAHGSGRTRLVARVLHRRAVLKVSIATRTRFRQVLPPFTLRFLLGALCIGLPLLLRSRSRTGRTVFPALAILTVWSRPGGILSRIYPFSQTA